MMIKMTTLYKKNQENLSLVINEIDRENEWVFISGVPTRKFDGSACAIINGELYKRYDAKKGKAPPPNSIPCQPPDEITGHWPHWIKCDRNNQADKYFFEAFDKENFEDGTYELCGEKVNSNPERIVGHKLIKHGVEKLELNDFSFNSIKDFLTVNDIEGIVFHDRNGSGKMCKIRKSDFGIKR